MFVDEQEKENTKEQNGMLYQRRFGCEGGQQEGRQLQHRQKLQNPSGFRRKVPPTLL